MWWTSRTRFIGHGRRTGYGGERDMCRAYKGFRMLSLDLRLRCINDSQLRFTPMVSKLAFLSNLFLAFVALAVPPSQLGTPRGEDIQSHPSDPSPVSRSREHPYRANPDWAGAMCTAHLTPYNYITADFVLPDVSPDPPDAYDGGVRFGVVLGDIKCTTVIMSTVQLTVLNGEPYYFGVFGPQINDVYNFTSDSKGFFKAGDHIRAIAYVSSVVGLAILENHTTGWLTSEVIPYLNRKVFCGGAAQWIVQDYKEEDSEEYVPLEHFYDVDFFRCMVSTPAPDADSCTPAYAEEFSLIERDGGPPLTNGGLWMGNMTIGFYWTG